MDEFLKKLDVYVLSRSFFAGSLLALLVFMTNTEFYLGLLSNGFGNLIGSLNVFILVYLFGTLFFVLYRYIFGEMFLYYFQLATSYLMNIFRKEDNRWLSDSYFFANEGYSFVDVRAIY